jgi:hypothetical protein
MPKVTKRFETLEALKETIHYKSEVIGYKLGRNLLSPEKIEDVRRIYRRLVAMYEWFYNTRYHFPRNYIQTNRDLMSRDLSDRCFKQQYRMERKTFEMIVSLIGGDEVYNVLNNYRYLKQLVENLAHQCKCN